MLNLIITFAFRSSISVGGHLGGFAAGILAGGVLFAAPGRPATPPGWRSSAPVRCCSSA